MGRECVFCNGYDRGVEFPCCSTFICNECLAGQGFEKSGGGIMFGGFSQVKCPADNVWVDT
jgi:hypothetical protein